MKDKNLAKKEEMRRQGKKSLCNRFYGIYQDCKRTDRKAALRVYSLVRRRAAFLYYFINFPENHFGKP
jgi:hypothetical protein